MYDGTGVDWSGGQAFHHSHHRVRALESNRGGVRRVAKDHLQHEVPAGDRLRCPAGPVPDRQSAVDARGQEALTARDSACCAGSWNDRSGPGGARPWPPHWGLASPWEQGARGTRFQPLSGSLTSFRRSSEFGRSSQTAPPETYLILPVVCPTPPVLRCVDGLPKQDPYHPESNRKTCGLQGGVVRPS